MADETDSAAGVEGGHSGDARLDELIPPPWPTRRRVLVALLVAALVAAGIVLARAGLLGPRLSHDSSWGSSAELREDGSIVAERLLPLRNDGGIEVAIESLELPELEAVRWDAVDGVPATVASGELHEIRIGFTVQSCDVDLGGFDVFPVRARSGLAPSRVIDVAPMLSSPTRRVSYLDDDGHEVTLPEWPDQEPSWILDTIEAPCTSPPPGVDGTDVEP